MYTLYHANTFNPQNRKHITAPHGKSQHSSKRCSLTMILPTLSRWMMMYTSRCSDCQLLCRNGTDAVLVWVTAHVQIHPYPPTHPNTHYTDYVGCFMVGAQPYTEQSHKFYEPQHTHVLTYPAYAYGPTYVLSNHVCWRILLHQITFI